MMYSCSMLKVTHLASFSLCPCCTQNQWKEEYIARPPPLRLCSSHSFASASFDCHPTSTCNLAFNSLHMYHITFATPSASNQWRKELSERIDARNRSLEGHTEAFPVFPTASFPWRSAAVQFHSPGAEYFEAVADAIAAARHCVFIADWWLSPQIYLKRRELPPNPAWRLDNLLQYVAQKGVKVYVIFYKETPGTLQTNSAKAEKLLKSLHSNINVLRHGPGYMNMYWSHHQKFVCVDYHTAFVGGIDLCFGRYETADMPLSDAALPHRFIGVDYYNPSYHGCVNDELCDAFHDRPELDRMRIPRMPWQDVAVSFGGEAAYDVAMGFIQRWNNHTAFQSATDIKDIQAFPKPLAVDHGGPTEQFSIRVVRSIAEVSCRSAPCCYYYSRYH